MTDYRVRQSLVEHLVPELLGDSQSLQDRTFAVRLVRTDDFGPIVVLHGRRPTSRAGNESRCPPCRKKAFVFAIEQCAGIWLWLETYGITQIELIIAIQPLILYP